MIYGPVSTEHRRIQGAIIVVLVMLVAAGVWVWNYFGLELP